MSTKSLNVFALTFAFLVSASSSAALTVQSLNDLPKQWEGVAGDLVTRVEASLLIESVDKVVLRKAPASLPAEYNVTAYLKLGSRKVTVKKIVLTPLFKAQSDNFEFTMILEDVLVPVISGAIRFDQGTKTFILKDFVNPPSGQRLELRGVN